MDVELPSLSELVRLRCFASRIAAMVIYSCGSLWLSSILYATFDVASNFEIARFLWLSPYRERLDSKVSRYSIPGDIACHPQAGYLGIAFTHAFHHLLQGSGYMEAMRAVLSGGGDTDTNACIVGGLIGAATGFQKLPSSMLRAVSACNVSEGRTRPAWLQTSNFVGIVEKIVGSPTAS